MSSLPQVTTCYALNDGKPSGDTFDTLAEAREQPEWVHLGHDVLRLYVAADGRIIHTEVVSEEEA